VIHERMEWTRAHRAASAESSLSVALEKVRVSCSPLRQPGCGKENPQGGDLLHPEGGGNGQAVINMGMCAQWRGRRFSRFV